MGSLEQVEFLHPGFSAFASLPPLLMYIGIRFFIASAPAGVNAGRAFSTGRSPGGGPSQIPVKSRGSNFGFEAGVGAFSPALVAWPKATPETNTHKPAAIINRIKRVRIFNTPPVLLVDWPAERQQLFPTAVINFSDH